MTIKMPIHLKKGWIDPSLKELQAQIKALGGVLIFHAKRIKQLEEAARPTPEPCQRCKGQGYIVMVGSSRVAHNVCPACVEAIPLTSFPPSPKTRMDKGRKGSKNK